VDEALLEGGPVGAARKGAASTTADFPVALAAKDLRLTETGTPVIETALRLLEALPEQTADVSAMTKGDRVKPAPQSPADAPFAKRFAHVTRLGLPAGALRTLSGRVAVGDAGEMVASGHDGQMVAPGHDGQMVASGDDGQLVAPRDAGAPAERIFQEVEVIAAVQVTDAS
jgi:hypothetical protein